MPGVVGVTLVSRACAPRLRADIAVTVIAARATIATLVTRTPRGVI
jgi:hypothetical protein